MDEWMRFYAQLRQASGEYAAMLADMPDEQVADALIIMQQELEKRMGQRMYKAWTITWLRRKLNGRWV